MNMNRRTLIGAVLAVSAVGVSPAVAGMDRESALMEDGSMWRAVAMNGTHLIYDDSRPTSAAKFMLAWDMSGEANATPARADVPQLRQLLEEAVADGRLEVAETAMDGVVVAWTVTMKGRFYAYEHTLEEPDDVYTFRQAVERYGLDRMKVVPNRRWVQLLPKIDYLSNVSVSEPWLVEEFAGLLQRGTVYPVAAIWRPRSMSRYAFRRAMGQDADLKRLARYTPPHRPHGGMLWKF